MVGPRRPGARDAGGVQHRADPLQVAAAQLAVVVAEHALAAQGLDPLLPRPAEPAQQLRQGLVGAGLELAAAAGEADQLPHPALGEVPVERLLVQHPRDPPGQRRVAAAGQRLQHDGDGGVDQQQRGHRVRPGRERPVERGHAVGAGPLGRVDRAGERQLAEQRVQHPGLAQLALGDGRAGHPDLQAGRPDGPLRQVPAQPVLVVAEDQQEVHHRRGGGVGLSHR